MRQIKFRAWDGTQLREVLRLGMENYKTLLTAGGYDDYEEVDTARIALMQFTGLTDKNGKEIYEGDIFPCNYCKKDRFKVVWDDNRATYRRELIAGEGCGNVHVMYLSGFTRSVCLGNIYENPELLN